MKRIFFLLLIGSAAWGQCVLVPNPLTGQLECGGSGSGTSGVLPDVVTFLSSATSISLTNGGNHNQGLYPVVLGCYLNSGNRISPKDVSTPDGSGNFTITLSSSAIGTAGYCSIGGGSGTGAGGGGGGGTASPAGNQYDVQYNANGTILGGIGNSTATRKFVMQVSSGAPIFDTLLAADIPSLDAAAIGSGTFATARIPSLDASKVTTGTFATAQIPSLDAAKITTGTFNVARIPNLSLGGDLGGTVSAAQVLKIQGYAVCNTAPTDAQILTYSTSSNCWGPVTPSATAAIVPFLSTDTTLTISGHGVGLNVSEAACWTSSGGTRTQFQPNRFQASTAGPNYIAQLTVATAGVGTDGACILSNFGGGGGSGGGGGGAVSSVFGRSGAVAASPGDYTASQVTNAFDKTADNDIGTHYFDIGTQVAPTSPASGKFRIYANSSTGKLGCKDSGGADCMPSGGGGGGGTGTVTNVDNTLDNLHANDPVLLSNTTGDVTKGTRTGNTAKFMTADASTWNAHTGEVVKLDSSGNATPGGTVKTQICTVSWVNSTSLTFASSAGVGTECNVSYPGGTISLAGSVPITIGGTGGSITVGFDLSTGNPKVYQSTSGLVTNCTAHSCSVSTGTPPSTFLPLWSWVVSTGTVASNAGTNLIGEAFGSTTVAGTGLTCTATIGQVVCGINTAVVPTHLPPQSFTINFPSQASGGCTSSSVTVSGATAQARVLIGPPTAAVANGNQFSGYVSAADTVLVSYCNFTGSTQDLASGSFTVQVFQ